MISIHKWTCKWCGGFLLLQASRCSSHFHFHLLMQHHRVRHRSGQGQTSQEKCRKARRMGVCGCWLFVPWVKVCDISRFLGQRTIVAGFQHLTWIVVPAKLDLHAELWRNNISLRRVDLKGRFLFETQIVCASWWILLQWSCTWMENCVPTRGESLRWKGRWHRWVLKVVTTLVRMSMEYLRNCSVKAWGQTWDGLF